MASSKDEVIKIADRFLKLIHQKHDVKQAYLFGSFAKDAAQDYSDVDLAVVLGNLATAEDSPFGEDFEIFHEAQKFNSLLEVVCFAQEEFDEERSSLARRIKSEGIRLI
jgi:predicted nucleotidyltransferase